MCRPICNILTAFFFLQILSRSISDHHLRHDKTINYCLFYAVRAEIFMENTCKLILILCIRSFVFMVEQRYEITVIEMLLWCRNSAGS